MQRSNRESALGLCAMLGMLLPAASASALTIPLTVEFDTGLIGNFGTIEVQEQAGALEFIVSLDTASLGASSDLNTLYFNVVRGVTGLRLTETNAPVTEYELSLEPPVRGGAGSDFDVVVLFGNGAGAKGNFVLQTATFTLVADEPLGIDSLRESSFAHNGSIEAGFAVHVQGTSLLEGADSETVGARPVPEPRTGLLMLAGLLALPARARLRRNR